MEPGCCYWPSGSEWGRPMESLREMKSGLLAAACSCLRLENLSATRSAKQKVRY
jgi:hypothetical protein